jgi:opacity protein-like surface antigen
MKKIGMALASLALAASLAHADDYLSPTNERVRLSIGAMRVSTTTDLRLDGSGGLAGNAISGEDDFGLASSSFEPKFQIMVRAGERHRLRLDYFSLDRTGHTTLGATAQPIVFKDVVFVSGDPIATTMNMRTLGITYEYSFIHRERFELAASVGVNDTDISLRARVQTEFRHVDQSEDQAGPLPTLGLDTTYVLSKRFYLDARMQYFKASIDHLDGLLSFYEVSAQYRLRPNISFALGYNSIKAYVDSRQAKTSGYFDFVTKGPEFFVRVAF